MATCWQHPNEGLSAEKGQHKIKDRNPKRNTIENKNQSMGPKFKIKFHNNGEIWLQIYY